MPPSVPPTLHGAGWTRETHELHRQVHGLRLLAFEVSINLSVSAVVAVEPFIASSVVSIAQRSISASAATS